MTGAEVLSVYPDAAVDEAKAAHWAGNWAREWERQFDRHNYAISVGVTAAPASDPTHAH